MRSIRCCSSRSSDRVRSAWLPALPAAATAVLDRALARWRGDALADASGALWAVTEVTRLGELQGQAWDRWSEAHLALGEHQQVVTGAEAAVARDPLRESMWRHLMLALYRSGRQADALRAFRRLGQALGELGLEPGREARALEEAILLQKPELDWLDAEMAGRRASISTRQPGEAFPRDGAAPTAPAPVPAAVGVARRGHFVGRKEEWACLDGAWQLAAKGLGRVGGGVRRSRYRQDPPGRRVRGGGEPGGRPGAVGSMR